MAGFRKARPAQAFLKLGLYGPAGSGKTFTSLLVAEGLAQATGKRIAFVDTEHGSDFYAQDVPSRKAHPAAFDFDALYTRSITETVAAVRDIRTEDHGIIVIDSMSHLWEAAIAAYRGRTTKIGTIPFQAWGEIKRPYKELVALLLGMPAHVLICGRQGNEYGEDEESGELKKIGVKMRAEGETPYEPHILIRLEAQRRQGEDAVIMAHIEKDRTGVLAGKTINWPAFGNLAAPILPLLGLEQAKVATEEEVAAVDGEAIENANRRRAIASENALREWTARISLCADRAALKELGKLITPEVKKAMLGEHVTALRDAYHSREGQLGVEGK